VTYGRTPHYYCIFLLAILTDSGSIRRGRNTIARCISWSQCYIETVSATQPNKLLHCNLEYCVKHFAGAATLPLFGQMICIPQGLFLSSVGLESTFGLGYLRKLISNSIYMCSTVLPNRFPVQQNSYTLVSRTYVIAPPYY